MPFDSWSVYTVDYDSYGVVRDKRYDVDLYKFLYNRKKVWDWGFAQFCDATRDGYLEWLASSTVFWMGATALVMWSPKMSIAGGAIGANAMATLAGAVSSRMTAVASKVYSAGQSLIMSEVASRLSDYCIEAEGGGSC